MAITLEPQVQWVTASPLWSTAAQEPARMQRPALLRFASDTFMEDMAALLQTAPEQLVSVVAQPESFRARPVGAVSGWMPSPPAQLKLYQPIHGHFYLIAATLVCRVPGMPDKVVNSAAAEKASFVLRRLATDGTEMAWVNNPTQPAAQGKGWLALSLDQPQAVAPYEELLPLFPVNFMQHEHKRRLLVGLIPTSSRETFQAGAALSPLPPDTDPALQAEQAKNDPRLEQVKTQVTERLDAWKSNKIKQPGNKDAQQILAQQEQEASLFILLDFAEMLALNLPTLWQAISTGTAPSRSDPGYTLYQLLATATAQTPTTWQQALKATWDQRGVITGEQQGQTTLTYNLRNTSLDSQALLDALQKALGPYKPPATPPDVDLTVPKLDARPGVRYVLRCVYQRPACGPLRPDVVSHPTEPFELAQFFDFDAPARQIRISLPVDTSVAGLRKFKKNVAFLLSDKLRQQMECVSDIKKAMDGELGCDQQFDLGTICSFSIPIITICALVVLLIFLILLNLVFWWLPFFRICFPISLKAKG